MSQLQFPGQTDFYSGKVRDVYFIGKELLVMIASDRISAFDVILPRHIPYKGQVLNQVAAHMLSSTGDICPNWLISTPTATAALGKYCVPYKVEVVVRGNLAGHAWRTYKNGDRKLCGVHLPDGMRENEYFPSPIITPTTKAQQGHDMDISREEILAQKLVSEADYEQIEHYAISLFHKGQKLAKERGLILVDTKYEFGSFNGEVYLMDEIHTPDSSRYFYAEGFEERLKNDESQRQLSKEFVREWLISKGFQGQPEQLIPEMSDEWVDTISQRYIELYEQLIGSQFIPQKMSDLDQQNAIIQALSEVK